jgi:4-carboxymuconolactone decarboxylase
MRQDLTDEQVRVYDAVTGGRRRQGRQFFPLTRADGSLTGPFNAMLLSPDVGMATQGLGGALRYSTALTGAAREIVIMTVAVDLDSGFELYAHEPIARHSGVSEDAIAAIKDHQPPALPVPAEKAAYDLSIALIRSRDVTDDEYEAAVAVLGERGVFEVSALVGYYSMLALQLRLFRVGTD